MMFRLFFNAETQRRKDAENTLCVSAPLRLCVKNFSFLPPPSLLRPLHGRNKAFTLIETALAMLAIGLGLLAIFGLGRLGLQSSKETGHDQRCAMMADAVFETLRDYNARFVDEARTNAQAHTWGQLWDQTRQNQFKIPFPPIAGMSASDQLFLRFNTALVPAYNPSEISIADWNPRYALYASFKDLATGTGSPGVSSQASLAITLAIYPDGDTYSSEYRLFRTTLTNPGGLP